MKKKILALAAILALVAVLVVPLAVLAETGTVQINGGTATVSPANITLTTTTLTGAELTATSASSGNLWTANDPRGTGAGWNVTIISTDFGSPANEKQSVTFSVGAGVATGGTFTLTYNTKTTAAIAWNAANTVVKSTLEALTNIETVTVTGGPLPAAVVVEFVDPGNQDVAQMTADGALLTGAGTPYTVTIATTVPGAPGIDISAGDQEFSIKIADANITVINGSLLKPTSAVTSLAVIPFTGGSVLKIVTAALATGMGNYNIPPEFSLEIPAETYAGTYQATMTIAINLVP